MIPTGCSPVSLWPKLLAFAGVLTLAACQAPPEPDPVEVPVEPEAVLPTALDLIPAHWDALPGWSSNDPQAALAAFVRSCSRWDNRPADDWLNPQAQWAGRIGEWRTACAAALMTAPGAEAARGFFQTQFTPIRLAALETESETREERGLLTGYYEPYVDVSETPTPRFSQPLRRRPSDLVTVDLGLFEEDLAGRRIVGEVRDGRLVLYKERSEIEQQDAGEVFAWGEPIEVFFLQIQGSGRIVYPDGRQERAAFAAHNGQPYRSIGRELIRRGELEVHAASKQGIEAWLEENGPEATAELFGVNPRYVFFQTQPLTDPDLGPAGSSGVALTPMASIAVDTRHHAHGVPVWMSADLPELEGWSGLVIAQDSGGAINGPLRGDFFWGWGQTAERRAGTTRVQAQWTAFLPTAVAQRLIDATPPA